MKINLQEYGWDEFFAKAKNSSENNELEQGRVVSVHKSKYEVVKSDGIFLCEILGNLQFQKNPLLKPAVGDWVLLGKEKDTFVIYEVLKRKSLIKRQKKHDNFPKPIAANIDKAVVVQSIGADFNLKRLNRILIHIHEAKITPMVVINKIDLLEGKNELQEIESELRKLNEDIPIIFLSSKTGKGMKDLEHSLKKEETVVFIGSSGVGKSSLINYMLGENRLETQEVMLSTGKGKHTTTARRLIKLDNGILVIDTPGTREFGMHGDDTIHIKQNFEYIEELSQKCKFSNCGHSNEPGCAIQKALKNNEIDEESYKNFLQLKSESRQTAKQMRQSEKQSSKKYSGQPLRSVRRGKNK